MSKYHFLLSIDENENVTERLKIAPPTIEPLIYELSQPSINAGWRIWGVGAYSSPVDGLDTQLQFNGQDLPHWIFRENTEPENKCFLLCELPEVGIAGFPTKIEITNKYTWLPTPPGTPQKPINMAFWLWLSNIDGKGEKKFDPQVANDPPGTGGNNGGGQ